MLEVIFDLPLIVKLLGSLGIILGLNALTKELATATIAGAVVLGLWIGHPVLVQGSNPGVFDLILDAVTQTEHLLVTLTVALTLVLSSLMAKRGVMKELVQEVGSLLPRRAAIASLPAIIGWLPMPGGAVVSAPLVDACDPAKDLAPDLKARINYWFRHVWELWWPLYPGVIWAIPISKLEPFFFIVLMLPISLATIAIGWFFLLRQVPIEHAQPVHAGHTGSFPRIVQLIAPILSIVMVYAILKITFLNLPFLTVFPILREIHHSNVLPMTIGCLIGIMVLFWQRPIPVRDWRTVLPNSKLLLLCTLFLCLFAYQAMIKAPLPNGLSFALALKIELASWQIPPVVVVACIAGIAGVVTGIHVGHVAASFPLLMGLGLPAHEFLPALIVVYGTGYIGMLASPVHVCLIVTQQHFKAKLYGILGRLSLPLVVLWGVILLHALVLWYSQRHP